MTIWIDRRWGGRHGIGRYATELYSRLTVDVQTLPVSGPTALGINALKPVPRGLIYSPGYGAFARAERQVLTIHDLIHLQISWPARAKYVAFYQAIAKPVIKRTGVAITVSETSRREIEAWIGDPRVDVINAGLGVSEAFTTDVQPVAPERPYLLYVGNMRTHKNLRTALAALVHVPEVELRLLVPTNDHGAVREVCDAHGVLSRVSFLSPMDDRELAELYRNASATLMPSTLEGFGLPALESIMTGTPVIYWAGCAAVAETVEDRGWPVEDAFDVGAWGAAMSAAVLEERRVQPVHGVYDWAATALTVDGVLARIA